MTGARQCKLKESLEDTMHLVQLNNQVSVSDQMEASDVAVLVANGIQLIVCNRPDHEDEGQPDFSEIKAAAEKAGLTTKMLAFASYHISADDRDSLIELIETKQKIHLYCRTGSRSRMLWQEANKIGCGGHDFQVT